MCGAPAGVASVYASGRWGWGYAGAGVGAGAGADAGVGGGGVVVAVEEAALERFAAGMGVGVAAYDAGADTSFDGTTPRVAALTNGAVTASTYSFAYLRAFGGRPNGPYCSFFGGSSLSVARASVCASLETAAVTASGGAALAFVGGVPTTEMTGPSRGEAREDWVFSCCTMGGGKSGSMNMASAAD